MDVTMPSGPVAAMAKVYDVAGRNSSLAAQLPSEPACPWTVSPLESMSFTAPNVPEEARTVIGASSRTPTARLTGDTATTAGVFPLLGVVVGEAGCVLGPASAFGGPMP